MCNSGQTFWNESLKTSMPLKQRCGPEFVCWVSPNSRPASISVVRCSSVGEPENRPECCFFGQALLLLLLPQNSCKAKLKGSWTWSWLGRRLSTGLWTSVLSPPASLARRQCCAPFRDEEVQGLQSVTDPAELLRWVLLYSVLQTSKSINSKTWGLEKTALHLYLFFPSICRYICVTQLFPDHRRVSNEVNLIFLVIFRDQTPRLDWAAFCQKMEWSQRVWIPLSQYSKMTSNYSF